MRLPRRILAIIDPTCDEQPAVRRAAAIAKIFDAELELYLSYYYSYLTDIADDYGKEAELFSSATLDELTSSLDSMAEELRREGVRAGARVEWKRSLYESIIDEALDNGADIVFKDTHYHTAIQRALFTNTDWNLIRHCPVPLWLVRQGTQPAATADQVPKILACVGLTNGYAVTDGIDDQVMVAACEYARALKGEVYALHAFNPLVTVAQAATWAVKPERLPAEKLCEDIRQNRSEALDRIAGRHGVPPERRLLKSGPLQQVLPGTATELGAVLSVLGSVRDSEHRSSRIGSTAESVLDHMPSDVLVLKPEGNPGQTGT